MGMFSTDLLSQVSEKMTNSKDLLFKGQQVFHLEICHRPGSAPTVPSSFFTVKLSKNENDPVGLGSPTPDQSCLPSEGGLPSSQRLSQAQPWRRLTLDRPHLLRKSKAIV